MCTKLIEELGNPYNPANTYYNRAQSYRLNDEPDKAIPDYEKDIGKDKAYISPYNRLADLYFSDQTLKDYFKVLDNYLTVLELDKTQ